MIRLAADIGGTFTDIAAFDERGKRLLLGKTLSTPARLVDGVSQGVGKAGTRFADAALFLHGSTVAINTLLERSGARTALLVTEGFRDIYEIGRINRPDAYNLFFRKHVPLVERSLRFEVRERMSAQGEVLEPLDEASVESICDRLEAERIEAVAIFLLHCYVNRAHEQRVKEIVRRRLPGAFVSASHELSEEYREFERCSTVVANAYIGPGVQRYIGDLNSHLERQSFRGQFLLVQSTGGLFEAAQAQSECVRILESGPAAGVIGARALCDELGLDEAIAFDMGGTTAKAGVIHHGAALTKGATLVGGYAQGLPVQIPMIDIFEVGTGGGSIAALDEAGALKVGPQSAGADPGPACYGRGGTRPTVTDANLLLGRLDGDRFLGGEMKLNSEAARKALEEHIVRPLGMTLARAADGILRIALTAMSYAVKGVSTDRGLDAAAFTLVAYGGAGPLHASAIAREIGMRRFIVPRAPGHFCAFGMLHADLRYDYVRSWFVRLEDLKARELERRFAALARPGLARLGRRKASVAYALDMRYVGQEHPVTVELPRGTLAPERIKALFDAEHLRRYGTHAPAERAEIVSLRATVVGPMKKPPLEKIPTGAARPPRAALIARHKVWFGERWLPSPVYARERLRAGNRIDGPALVEEHASTTLLQPGDRLRVDGFGNLDVEVRP